MQAKVLLHHILVDDALTRGLGDPEARILVEWLVERAESLAEESSESTACATIARLCRRGRAIGRFVSLWVISGRAVPPGNWLPPNASRGRCPPLPKIPLS
jgi:hypothetical protein